MKHFTLDQSHADDRRVISHLRLIRRRLTPVRGWLDSAFLAGGFARGEGRLVNGLPDNDYDIVLVWKNRLVLPLGAAFAKPALALARRDIGCRYLDYVHHARTQPLPPTLFHADNTLHAFRFIGRTPYQNLGGISIRDVPAAELQRQLCNRCVCLLEALPLDAPYHRDPTYRYLVRHQAAKAALAVIDAVLHAAAVYAGTVREKLLLAEQTGHRLALPLVPLVRTIKFGPNPTPSFETAQADWRRLHTLFRDALDTFDADAWLNSLNGPMNILRPALRGVLVTQRESYAALADLIRRYPADAIPADTRRRAVYNWYRVNNRLPPAFRKWGIV